MIVNCMFWRVRCRELIFILYILKYYFRFKDENIFLWVDCDCLFNIEGGDELVLFKDVFVIGIFECIFV